MLLMIVCGVLLAAGVVFAVLWRHEQLVEPEDLALQRGATCPRWPIHVAGLRIYLWWATLFTVVGTASGVLITGAGGRLIMRLIAATSPDATGRLTEAQATVGEISFDGTISLLVFGALPLAFLSTALYLVVAPWLPRGALGGAIFGVAAFIGVSAFIDPLRAENIDFNIVGPGWLSVIVFAVLGVLQGVALAAFTGRLSRSLPLVSRRNWWVTFLLLLPAVVYVPIGILLATGALVALAFPRLLPWFLRVRASRGGILVGRVILVVAVLAALPAFIGAVVSIWGR